MSDVEARHLTAGASQHQLRNFNERLILTLLQRHGALPGSEIARRANLSPQTISVILRRLEQDGLLTRGDPQRGRVGKPSVPMALAPRGVLALGLKVGRRSADLVLLGFDGAVLGNTRTTYAYPTPDAILAFLREAIDALTADLSIEDAERLAGFGIAMPYELWNWERELGVPQGGLAGWREMSLEDAVAEMTGLPVFIANDATAACRAEHVYGRGKAFRDYAYFFVGSFIGGGVVLNNTVYEGHRGNAGAFGSLPIPFEGGTRQLIDTASIHLLEAALADGGRDPSQLWHRPLDWSGFDDLLRPWIVLTADQLAKASLMVCAVIDFEAVLIDGDFPAGIRAQLVEATQDRLETLDCRGLLPPRVEAGLVGPDARALGAACAPVFSSYLLDTLTGLSAV